MTLKEFDDERDRRAKETWERAFAISYNASEIPAEKNAILLQYFQTCGAYENAAAGFCGSRGEK